MMLNESLPVNRVANSGLITINLEQFLPVDPVIVFDIADHLFMGMILREKDFREALANTDWTAYEGKVLLITCTADAIVPLWAYMLITTLAQPYAKDIYQSSRQEYENLYIKDQLAKIDIEAYRDKRIVIKGCSDREVSAFAYTEVTKLLRPVVLSIMYGEPCSTVPIYKRPRDK